MQSKNRTSYFMVLDDDHILLVDHLAVEPWLPTGGDVEPGEHPKTTTFEEVK